MGGNAFEDTEHLTPQEYQNIVKEIMSIISPICLKIQPYIPLPEKDHHGDIDFLIVLKEQCSMSDIQGLLKIESERFIKNNNHTANSVYRNKQVDFNVAANDHEFELCRFYKSYGGIGAFLGLFLPSKFVKLNETGLVCCAYLQHIKLQFLVCNNIHEILMFYGLEPQRYDYGFQTRKDLFQYLRNLRFLDESHFLSHTTKNQTKIMKYFQQYLKMNGVKQNQKYIHFEDSCLKTLQYFNKMEQFDSRWKQMLAAQSIRKERQNKWNGMHIMNIFQIESKKVNSYKRQFQQSFISKQKYENFIQSSSFEQIVLLFSKICHVHPIK